MRKTLSLTGILVLLSFCSQIKIRQLPYPEGIVFPLESAGGIAYEGEIAGEILYREQKLFFATWDGTVICADSADRSLCWKTSVSERLTPPLILFDERLFTADRTNTLYCLDLQGQILWKRTVESPITGPAAGIGEKIYFGTEQGNLVALDGKDGREIWKYSAGAAIRSNPVAAGKNIVFGCDNHFLYVLDGGGSLVSRFEMEYGISATLCLDNQFLFFGTENGYIVCFDTKKELVRWKVRTGGAPSTIPLISGNRIYFLTADSVLYCLNRTTGTILWWQAISSRIPFRLLMVEEKILVSSLSSNLICFDRLTGDIIGRADVGGEMKSNAVWAPPHLLVSVFDRAERKEKIVSWKKQIDVALSTEPESPQVVNTEIQVSAEAVGFHQPLFEFFIDGQESRRIVQIESGLNRWAWFPSEPGKYSIGVTVRDERQKEETKISFIVEREKPQVSLTSSVSSPRRLGSDILFSISARGLTNPDYRFHVYRLFHIPLGAGGYLLDEVKDEKGQIIEYAEKGSWKWTPRLEGIYLIHAIASDGERQSETYCYFLIMKGNF